MLPLLLVASPPSPVQRKGSYCGRPAVRQPVSGAIVQKRSMYVDIVYSLKYVVYLYLDTQWCNAPMHCVRVSRKHIGL